MRIRMIILLLSFGLIGCATSTPASQPPMAKEEVAEMVKDWTTEKIHSYIHPPYRSTKEEKAILRREMVNRHPEWSEEVKESVLEGKVFIDMTKEQVLASWGKPDDINRTVTKFGTHEQWVYNYGIGINTYLYLENNVVTSWQD